MKKISISDLIIEYFKKHPRQELTHIYVPFSLPIAKLVNFLYIFYIFFLYFFYIFFIIISKF